MYYDFLPTKFPLIDGHKNKIINTRLGNYLKPLTNFIDEL